MYTLALLAGLFLAQAQECLTIDWWNTVAEANDFQPVGNYGHGFVAAMASIANTEMPKEWLEAASVGMWVGPSKNEIVLHFFDKDGCDVARWTSISPEQLQRLLRIIGPGI